MVMWDEQYLKYKFSDWHPMHPSRLELTYRLSDELDVFDAQNVSIQAPEVAEDAVIGTIHDQTYIDQVRRVSQDPAPVALLLNLGADGLEMEIGFWIDDPENGRGNVLSEVNRAILRALQERNINIPYPQRELRIVNKIET